MKLIGLTLASFLAAGPTFAQEGKFERTLKVSGTVDLDLMTDSGGIVVTPGPPGSVHIRAILKGQLGWMFGGSADIESRIRRLEQNPPIHQTGNTIQVGHVARNELRGISMRLEIITPPDAKLRARADSGGIRVDGIKGPVDCHTDSGGVEARNIGSEVRAGADSGGIHIRNVQGPVYARADSGGIEALDVAGAIDAQTDSGGINVAQTKPDIIHAKADSGGAHVRLASNAGYDVRASSDSGHVSVAEVVVRGTISKHRTEGKVRGGGPLVDVHAGSGTVTVE
jgi:Putative adhesin